MDKQRIQETYRLDGVGHGDLDLEMRWLSVMEVCCSDICLPFQESCHSLLAFVRVALLLPPLGN